MLDSTTILLQKIVSKDISTESLAVKQVLHDDGNDHANRDLSVPGHDDRRQ